MDGLALAQHLLASGQRSYPFALTSMPPASGPEALAIETEVAALIDVNDALADLVLAEGVHQGVLGNSERVSAVLDAGLAAAFPPEPAVLETPVAGLTMTQRVAVHLRAGLAPSFTPVIGLAPTPRAMTAPAVNEFVTSMLPDPAEIVALVRWHAGDAEHERAVSVVELGLQAVDLLALVKLDEVASLDTLDDLLVSHVVSSEGLDLSTDVRIAHTEAVPGAWTFFELGAALSYLRSVTSSRPLRATDLMLASSASGALPTPIASRAGIDLAVKRLDAVRADIELERGALSALVADPLANRDAIIDAVDGAVASLRVVMPAAVEFGVLTVSPEAARSRARDLLVALRAAAAARSEAWTTRLSRADAGLAKEGSLPTLATASQRVAALAVAEQALRAQITSPLPTDPVAYRSAVATLRTQVATARTALTAVLDNGALADSLDKARSTVDAAAFDPEALDVTAVEDGCVALVIDIEAALRATVAQIDQRRSAVNELLTTFDTAASGGDTLGAAEGDRGRRSCAARACGDLDPRVRARLRCGGIVLRSCCLVSLGQAHRASRSRVRRRRLAARGCPGARRVRAWNRPDYSRRWPDVPTANYSRCNCPTPMSPGSRRRGQAA